MLTNNNFNGEINGVSMVDFTSSLDYKLNQKDRVKHLHKILNDERGLPKEFFEELFIQESDGGIDISKVKVQLGQKDALYSESNVAKSLEMMANYILYAKDGESLTKKTKYNFFKSEQQFEQRVRNKRLFYNDVISKKREEAEAIDFLLNLNNQYKKPKTQKIFKEDLKHPVLAEYQKAIDRLTVEMKAASELKAKAMIEIKDTEINSEDYKHYKKILKDAVAVELTNGKIIKSLKDDQCLAKDMLFGTIYFKQTVSRELTESDYDLIDFNNTVHIRELLRCGLRNNLSRNLDCITVDIDNIIQKLTLTDKEKLVINMLRSDARLEDIVKKFGQKTYKQYINMTVNKIIKMIIKEYDKQYKDWYYTYVEKGTYIKCSSCKEQKLIHHFNTSKTNQNRVRCIECEKKAYQLKKARQKKKEEGIL